MENVPLWKGNISDELKTQLLFCKVFHSDQFWWASCVKVGDTMLYNGIMISRALELFSELVSLLETEEIGQKFEEARAKVLEEMKKYEDNLDIKFYPNYVEL